MSFDLGAPIEVNTFGFNIPSHEFIISAQITRDKRMPLVDEFILRVLNLVDRINITKLARFFTFEGPELAIALADLEARSLVVVRDEVVELHMQAKELFRTAADKEQPTIPVVEEFHANVWFDLISQGLIARRGSHNARNLISLKPARSDMEMGADFARAAFDANFHDYLRRVRNIKNADQWSLYSILDVQSGRHSYSQWLGREQLLLSSSPKLEPVLIPEEENRTPRLKRLAAAMADELQHIGAPPASAAARDEYGRLLGNDTLRRALRGDGYFGLTQWWESQFNAASPSVAPIIGYPYLQRNTRQLVSTLSAAEAKSLPASIEVFWLRPGGNAWGATEDVNSFLRELRAALRQLGCTEVRTTLLVPTSVPAWNALRSFERIFDRGVHLPPNSLPASLELLVIPQMAAVVCAAVSLSSNVDVPIGTITAEPDVVQRIEERSNLQALSRTSTLLWPKSNRPRSSRQGSGEEVEGAASAGEQ